MIVCRTESQTELKYAADVMIIKYQGLNSLNTRSSFSYCGV